MTDSFLKIRQIIESGKICDAFLREDRLTNAQRRFLQALTAEVDSKYFAGDRDIVCLIRQILLQEEKQTIIKIPRKYPYPEEREIWEESGIDILREDDKYFHIQPHFWQPKWLKYSPNFSPDLAIFSEEFRRHYDPVAGDPFLQRVNRETYRNSGQRDAVRAILSAPKNATLVVNLATGSGKSLVFQIPVLLSSKGLSIVIIPTTALALDQERILLDFISHPTAYYSGNSEEDLARRSGIRDRIFQGTQRIVFTSPEALMSSLLPSVYHTAKARRLNYFVIDEAHIIEQWGDNFRPAFQEVSGLRKDLLRYTSFQTLLLTATLTEICLDVLENLFGQPGEFQVISALQIRPEPSYWVNFCPDEETRKARLLEAIYYLPRPLIIYATRKEDVRNWGQILTEAGFGRYSIITGESTPEERAKLVQNWQKNQIDIVIATSAFGMGIDRSDVRAIIHTCIPETLDRFYQEVGRGGRDGKASLSLILYTKDDLNIARSLNEKSLISCERGLKRWQTMFHNKTTLPDGRFVVNIDHPPSLSEQDIDMNSQENLKWNVRTLILMSQAGLIEIDWQKPPKKIYSSSQEDYDIAWKQYRHHRVIKILNEYHLDEYIWETQVESIRQKQQQFNRNNLELMQEILRERQARCITEIFAETYEISARESPYRRKKVNASLACGGCAFCRQNNRSPFAGILPSSRSPWETVDYSLGEQLKKIMRQEKLLIIFYDSPKDNKLERIVTWSIQQGVKNLVSDRKLYPTFHKISNRIPNRFVFLFEKYYPFNMPNLPTLIWTTANHCPRRYLSVQTIPCLLLLPINTVDPDRNDRKLIDIFNGRSFRLQEFCVEVGI